MYKSLKTSLSVIVLLFATNLIAMNSTDTCSTEPTTDTSSYCYGLIQGAQCYTGPTTFKYRDKSYDSQEGPSWYRQCASTGHGIKCFCGITADQKASVPGADRSSKQTDSNCVGGGSGCSQW